MPLAAFWTVGEQACDPATGMIAALAGVGGALLVAGTWGERQRIWPGLLVLSLLPLSRWLAEPGLPAAHDLRVHAWSIWSTAQGMRGGSWWPRWHPLLGLGMPVGQFYGPLPYLLGGVLVWAGVPTPWTLGLLGWATGVLGMGTTAAVTKDLGLGARATAIAALGWLLAPYALLDLSYRYALGERFGLALLPLVWWLALRVALDRPGAWIRRPRAWLWASASALVLCHPLSVILGLSGGLVLGLASLERRRPRGLGGLVVVGLLVGLTTAAYTLPVAVEGKLTRIQAVLPPDAEHYQAKALHLGQTLTRDRWDALRNSTGLAKEEELREAGEIPQDMPHYLGWTLFLPLLFGLAGWGRSRVGGALSVAGLACWVATMPAPAGWMGQIELFHILQMPWRFLGPASVAGALALGIWLDPVARLPRFGRVVAPLALLALLFDAWPGLGAASWMEWDASVPLAFHVHRKPAPTCRAGSEGWWATPFDLATLEGATPARAASGGPGRSGASWVGDPVGDLPPRLTRLALPPTGMDPVVGLVYPVQPEFLTTPVYHSFLAGFQRSGPAALADAGVAGLVRTGGADPLRRVNGWPRVRLRHQGSWFGLRAMVERTSAEAISLTLPAGQPGGRLMVVEEAFAGWEARVGDGAWEEAGSERGLLAVDLPVGAERVELRFVDTWPRKLGGALSVLGLLGVGVALWRRQRERAGGSG